MMSIFRIPDSILDDIQAMMARFWWGSLGDNRKMHWHSWANLCSPKKNGGMGFRDLKCFNQALLARQIWRLMEKSNCLLNSVLKARYYKNDLILDARREFDPSFSWRSLWGGAKSLLLEGLGWRIGKGNLVCVMKDKWLLHKGSFIAPVLNLASDTDFRVGELIDEVTGSWDVDKLLDLFDQNTFEAILSIPLEQDENADTVLWGLTKSGCYTVKSVIGSV